jgi:hypothetical protein
MKSYKRKTHDLHQTLVETLANQVCLDKSQSLLGIFCEEIHLTAVCVKRKFLGGEVPKLMPKFILSSSSDI